MNTPASTAPKAIYLDIGDRAALESIEAGGPWETEGVTWSEDNATGDGIRYVRADLASTASAITDEQLRAALVIAEAALADIGDADREPGDDVAWCEARAAQALPQVRAALAAPTAQPTGQSEKRTILQQFKDGVAFDMIYHGERRRVTRMGHQRTGVIWAEAGSMLPVVMSADGKYGKGDLIWLERAAVEPSQPAEYEPESLQWKFECVIDHATGGKLSKSGWALATIKAAIDQHVSTVVDDMLEDERASRTPAPAAPSADAQDAARYRYLRDGPDEWGMFEDRWLVAVDIYGQGPLDMDDAIDAAIEASTKGASS